MAPGSSEYSSRPSVVAAAQLRPVGDSATARDRTAGRRLPPVPGRSSAPAGPPIAHRDNTPLTRHRKLSVDEVWAPGACGEVFAM